MLHYDIRKYLIYSVLSLRGHLHKTKEYQAGQDRAFAQRQRAKCIWQNRTKFESLAETLKFAVSTGWYHRTEGGLVYASVSQIFFIHFALEMREESGPI